MKHPRSTNIIVFVCVVALAAVSAIGQQVEASYDLTLQLVVGSNEGAVTSELPSSLAAVSQQIKSRFGFSNYRLANTFLSRIGEGGDAEYKSMVNIFGDPTDPMQPTFLELAVNGFRNLSQQKGMGTFHSRTFRFGARVPVQTGGPFKDDAGKSRPIVNYEHIGLTLTKLGVAENVPTLVGTLNLPGANGTIFLVMTVRAAEM